TFLVEKNGKPLGYMRPEIKIHFKNSLSGERSSQYTSEVSIRNSYKEDLYLILSSYNDDESGTFKVLINPLVKWIWLGGVVMTIGGLIALIPTKPLTINSIIKESNIS
ncbi:MAG: cytochrome c-type biogenesis CcmF C-terminal domain-containing protein, partial [Nitrospinota bacterium]